MINWLQSYPKSGNTWVRIFLSAYIQDKEPDINDLVATISDQMIEAHKIGFELDDIGIDLAHYGLIRPMALLRVAYTYQLKKDKEQVDGKDVPLILKTHAANAIVTDSRLIPQSITDKVVVIIRDPRDIAISYAKHYALDMDEAVKTMVDRRATLFDKEADEKPPHHVMSWNENVYTYASATDLDVTIVKYEQLKEDPVRYFTHILKWYGMPVDEMRVRRAVKNCEISKLRKQEEVNGFGETSKKADKFFGKGIVGEGVSVLTREQQDILEEHCKPMMIEFGYLEEAQEHDGQRSNSA